MAYLRVITGQPRRPRRVTENVFERKCGEIAKASGCLYLKADATDGWPDRYFGGGNWVELKSEMFTTAIQPMRFVRPEQRVFMDMVSRRGDDARIAFFLFHVHGIDFTQYVIWSRWREFKECFGGQRKLTRKQIKTHPLILTDTKFYDEFKCYCEELVK